MIRELWLMDLGELNDLEDSLRRALKDGTGVGTLYDMRIGELKKVRTALLDEIEYVKPEPVEE